MGHVASDRIARQRMLFNGGHKVPSKSGHANQREVAKMLSRLKIAPLALAAIGLFGLPAAAEGLKAASDVKIAVVVHGSVLLVARIGRSAGILATVR